MPEDLSPEEVAYLEANAFIHVLIDGEPQDAKAAKKWLIKNNAQVPAIWTDREIIKRAIAFRNELNAGANGSNQAVAMRLSLCFSATNSAVFSRSCCTTFARGSQLRYRCCLFASSGESAAQSVVSRTFSVFNEDALQHEIHGAAATAGTAPTPSQRQPCQKANNKYKSHAPQRAEVPGAAATVPVGTASTQAVLAAPRQADASKLMQHHTCARLPMIRLHQALGL